MYDQIMDVGNVLTCVGGLILVVLGARVLLLRVAARRKQPPEAEQCPDAPSVKDLHDMFDV